MVSKVIPGSRNPRARIPRKRSAPLSRIARVTASGDDRALSFLGEVLAGETRWQLEEVQRLLALHTLAAIAHWHAEGLDGPSR